MEGEQPERLRKKRSRKQSHDNESSSRTLPRQKRNLFYIILGIWIIFHWSVGTIWDADQQLSSLPGGCVHFNPIPLTDHLSSIEHRWRRALDVMIHLRALRVPASKWGGVAQRNRDIVLSIGLPSNDKLSELYSDLDICHRNLLTEIEHLLAVFSIATWKVVRNTDKISTTLQRESKQSFWRKKRPRQIEMEELYQRWTVIMRDVVLAVGTANSAVIQAAEKSTKVWDKISDTFEGDWKQLETEIRRNRTFSGFAKSLFSLRRDGASTTKTRGTYTQSITDARQYYENATQWPSQLQSIWEPLGRIQDSIKASPGFEPSWMSACESDAGNGSAWRAYELVLVRGMRPLVEQLKTYERNHVLCSLARERGWHQCVGGR